MFLRNGRHVAARDHEVDELDPGAPFVDLATDAPGLQLRRIPDARRAGKAAGGRTA